MRPSRSPAGNLIDVCAESGGETIVRARCVDVEQENDRIGLARVHGCGSTLGERRNGAKIVAGDGSSLSNGRQRALLGCNSSGYVGDFRPVLPVLSNCVAHERSVRLDLPPSQDSLRVLRSPK